MSTGLECFFVETEKDEWYYILESWDTPKLAWNWLDYATAYGSFASFDDAYNHLSDNHANPGGYSKMEFDHFDKLSESQKETYTDLTKHATRNI
jgi:hypothetical protein